MSLLKLARIFRMAEGLARKVQLSQPFSRQWWSVQRTTIVPES